MSVELKPNTSVSLKQLKDDLKKICPSSVAASSLINMRSMIINNNNNKNYDIKQNKNGSIILKTGSTSIKLIYLVPNECNNIRLAKY